MRSTTFFLSKATTTSSEEISKDQGKIVHFNASDASKEMIFNHRKSSNDLSSLFGIACVPQAVSKDNGQTLRSRSYRASSIMSTGAMTTPPQAVPLVTGRALPPAPLAMTRTAPSCITFPLALSTTTLEQPGLTPAASPCLKLRRWHNTVGYSTPSMRQTRRKLSGPTSPLLDTFATNSNHRLGHLPHNTLNL